MENERETNSNAIQNFDKIYLFIVKGFYKRFALDTGRLLYKLSKKYQ